MFRLLLRIGILAVMILALAIPKVDARAAPANAAALASQRRALLSARPPRNERRSLIEVATQGLFDLFGFEVGGRCRRAARPRSGSCTYRDSAIPRFRSSATFASVASTRRSPSRRPTLDENDRRSLLPPAASSSNSLRDVRPAVRVRQPHAGRGEQAELRRGLRVTVQASNGHRKTRRERARRTPLSQPRGSASSQLVKRESA